MSIFHNSLHEFFLSKKYHMSFTFYVSKNEKLYSSSTKNTLLVFLTLQYMLIHDYIFILNLYLTFTNLLTINNKYLSQM